MNEDKINAFFVMVILHLINQSKLKGTIMTNKQRKELSFRSRVHHGIKKRIKNNRRSIRIDVRKQLRLIAREEST